MRIALDLLDHSFCLDPKETFSRRVCLHGTSLFLIATASSTPTGQYLLVDAKIPF